MPLLFGAQLASPKALVWWVGQVGHGMWLVMVLGNHGN